MSEKHTANAPAAAATIILIGVLAASAWAAKHHAFSSVFDPEVPIDLSGTVTEVQWMNPHTWFYIDVRNDDGTTVNWGLEMGSPNSLVRRGWDRNSLEVGDAVTVVGFRARDGSLRGAVRTVTLASGERLFGAQDESR